MSNTSWKLGGLAASLALLSVARVEAQGLTSPDAVVKRPHVVLLLDTSGSMQFRGDVECTSEECLEGRPAAGERNRWATVVEVLTGSWLAGEFATAPIARPVAGAEDSNYWLPHYGLPIGGPFGTAAAPSGQQNDGILDAYLDRVRFGLMTFDVIPTVRQVDGTIPSLMLQADYNAYPTSWSPLGGYGPMGMHGGYSYPGGTGSAGSAVGGNRPFRIVLDSGVCPDTYQLNVGARRPALASDVGMMGPLVSVGLEGVTDPNAINASIQTAILGVRPYGATPIAGMLEDARHYFTNHSDMLLDTFKNCRQRYIIVLTDGLANTDMRGDPYNCDAPGGTCPYAPIAQTVTQLCNWSTTLNRCTGPVDGVFAVGFSLDDPTAISALEDIAKYGGTGTPFVATDADELMKSLSEILDVAAPGTTTRTSPTFAQAATGLAAGGNAQYQFTTGFQPSDTGGTPWSGRIERQRYICNAALVPEPQPISDAHNDRFHKVLNDRNLVSSPRTIWTVLPTDVAADVNGMRANIGRYGSGAVKGSVKFSKVAHKALTATQTQALSAAENADILAWIEGSHAARKNRRLGAVYHSTPTVISAPRADIADESYNRFRNDPTTLNRPTVLYVQSNDGQLHAFATEEHEFLGGAYKGKKLTAGHELWSFLPPYAVPSVRAAMSAPIQITDASPVVRDVLTVRLPGGAPSKYDYKTILVAGLRGGGNGFYTLDVTDPMNPQFLWQFVDPNFGDTYGTPFLTQILLNFDDGSGAGEQLQIRGVAILPGGLGTNIKDDGLPCLAPVPEDTDVGADGVVTTARAIGGDAHCYGDGIGRQLAIIDILTGKQIIRFSASDFPAPLIGGVAVAPGDVGQTSTRAFITDANDFIWRLDMSSPKPSEWSVNLMHDMWYNAAATLVEFPGSAASAAAVPRPSYFPPVVTTNLDGEYIVIQGTGNLDDLETNPGNNKVVSIKEIVEYDSLGLVTSLQGEVEWEIQFEPGELSTGPLALFGGNVYFGSYAAIPPSGDACDYGRSRLWGVHYYLQSTEAWPEGTVAKGGLFPPVGIMTGGSTEWYQGWFDNQIVMGVGVTQRPTCFAGEADIDPFTGGKRYKLSSATVGDFVLIAQVGGIAGAYGSEIGTIELGLPEVQQWTFPLGVGMVFGF